MFRRSLVGLSLCASLVGCSGAKELRSAACDEGKPVLASGVVTLTSLFRKEPFTDVSLVLYDGPRDTGPQLAFATLDQPEDFPIPFTLCGELEGPATDNQVTLRAAVRRATPSEIASQFATYEFHGAPLEQISIAVPNWSYPLGDVAAR